MAAIYIQCINLITGSKGEILTVTISDSNQHGMKVLSLDMPLLKKCIMITWPTVRKQLECHGFTLRLAFCTIKAHGKVTKRGTEKIDN